MRVQCPTKSCRSSRFVRNGTFKSKYRTRPIVRFRCSDCGKGFSRATFQPCYRQKKRQLNPMIEGLLCSSTSERRIALLLKINRKTVARRLVFFAYRARLSVHEFLMKNHQSFDQLYFDEMETFEHSNTKPVSVPLIVTKNRKVLGLDLATFLPRSPRLREISLKKYGPRADQTKQKAMEVWDVVSKVLPPTVEVHTDQKSMYRGVIKSIVPRANHLTHESKRAAVVGQGELKEKGFDPLFPINMTFAQARDNIKRLTRRSWCTTKKLERLMDHLWVYAEFHNRILTN